LALIAPLGKLGRFYAVADFFFQISLMSSVLFSCSYSWLGDEKPHYAPGVVTLVQGKSMITP